MSYLLLGVLAYGALCGYVLGVAWKKIKTPKIKTAATLIGAFSTGIPIAFVEGLGDEKLLYPIGLVVGFFWSGVAEDLRVIARGRKQVGAAAWHLAVVKSTLVLGGTLGILLLGFTRPDGRRGDEVAALQQSEMPCRLAWVFLGRYSSARRGYEIAPHFRYPDGVMQRGAVPEIGDKIVVVAPRNLIVTGYGLASEGDRCNRMLTPPFGYRPETDAEYVAGKINPPKLVVVNRIEFLPSADADPTYVWALIEAPAPNY